MGARVVGAHAEQREDDDGRVRPGVPEQLTDQRVDLAVDVLDHVAGSSRALRVVLGMVGVVVAPTAMADTVRLGEDGHEDVPVLGVE